jgi:hypothetical protein
MPSPGRPSLGHAGHRGRADRCDACRLRAWRQARGLTQAKAAAMIPSGARYSTGLRTYHAWERGDAPVPVLVLRLLEMLG